MKINYYNRQNKGITLIALVITIIVLLILAAVSLQWILGNDGILNRATIAVDETKIARAKEHAELVAANYTTQFYERKYLENKTDYETAGSYVSYMLSNGETSDNYYIKTSGTTVTVCEDKNRDNTYAIGTIEDDGLINWGEPIEKGLLEGIQLIVNSTFAELTTVDIVDININTFPEGVNEEYNWKIEDEEIASIYEKTDNTISLRGLKAGTTKLQVTDKNGNLLKIRDEYGNVMDGDYVLKVYEATVGVTINLNPSRLYYTEEDYEGVYQSQYVYPNQIGFRCEGRGWQGGTSDVFGGCLPPFIEYAIKIPWV